MSEVQDAIWEALEKIANVLPTDLQNPASIELWAAKAKDSIRIAKNALKHESQGGTQLRELCEKMKAYADSDPPNGGDLMALIAARENCRIWQEQLAEIIASQTSTAAGELCLCGKPKVLRGCAEWPWCFISREPLTDEDIARGIEIAKKPKVETHNFDKDSIFQDCSCGWKTTVLQRRTVRSAYRAWQAHVGGPAAEHPQPAPGAAREGASDA